MTFQRTFESLHGLPVLIWYGYNLAWVVIDAIILKLLSVAYGNLSNFAIHAMYIDKVLINRTEEGGGMSTKRTCCKI